MSEREPICPFCWARRRIYSYLEFRIEKGYWECPICLARSESPDDDEEEIRRQIEQERQERAMCQYPNGDLAPLRHPGKSGGKRKSGRRRKKEVSRRRPTFPGTLA